MESILFSFSDFPEDVQLRILSLLDPFELEAFARTSKKFLTLCRYDERLWFLKCSRLWGSQTQIQKWGGGKISYKRLFHFLPRYEYLIGFWKAIDNSPISMLSSSALVFFEWGSFYITGYRISHTKRGGYCVMKHPFLWVTATSDGKALTYLDTTGSVSLTEEDLSREDSEKLRDGLILVDIRTFLGNDLSVEENPQFFEFRRRLSTRNGLTELENVYRSPPDRLMTEIYKILAGKISITSDATSKKEKRRERQREREKWRRSRRWESQHFFKRRDLSRTPWKPLLGLWEGVCPDGSLNLYQVNYAERRGHISCQIITSTSTLDPFYKTVFTTPYTAFIEPPYPLEEESMYNSRVHLRLPCAEANQPGHDHATSSYDQDVVRMYYAKSNDDMNPLHLLFEEFGDANGRIFEEADGRIWLYADGTFGFGFLQDDYIVDLKHVIKNMSGFLI